MLQAVDEFNRLGDRKAKHDLLSRSLVPESASRTIGSPV
jgi:hypothetical protein